MLKYRTMRFYSYLQRNARTIKFLSAKHLGRESPGIGHISRFQLLLGYSSYCPCSAKFNRNTNFLRPKSEVCVSYRNKQVQDLKICLPLSNHITSRSDKYSFTLKGEIDRFGALRISMQQQAFEFDNQDLLRSHKFLRTSLLETISQCRDDGQSAIWLEVPAHLGHIIPIAAEAGFTFHHAEGSLAVMCQWLGTGESRIPDYATHQIGVSGFVLDEDSGKVLMIQDKHRIARWKFPGGYSKLGEDFSETATREVLEETGIRSEFKSILAFRQQHHMPYSFDRSDIYVVCRLKPLTYDITVCSEELLDARWMHVKDLLTSEEHTPLTKQVANLANQGLSKGTFNHVDIAMSELPSVYKGKMYKLFCRSHVLGENAF